jgi:hypothetical protein
MADLLGGPEVGSRSDLGLFHFDMVLQVFGSLFPLSPRERSSGELLLLPYRAYTWDQRERARFRGSTGESLGPSLAFGALEQGPKGDPKDPVQQQGLTAPCSAHSFPRASSKETH